VDGGWAWRTEDHIFELIITNFAITETNWISVTALVHG
jgi:hypothetical protein